MIKKGSDHDMNHYHELTLVIRKITFTHKRIRIRGERLVVNASIVDLRRNDKHDQPQDRRCTLNQKRASYVRGIFQAQKVDGRMTREPSADK